MLSAKEIVKKYSYVFIPIHITVTGFAVLVINYFLLQGFDFASILEEMHVSDNIVHSLRNPKIGKFTVILILVKLLSPLRWFLSITATATFLKLFKK
ncbi:hypothetical protein Trydic_g20163 [Trypoxylus dichotomus]